MLELIVLGQVPGTSFVITLNWALLLSALVFSGLLTYKIVRRHHPRQAEHGLIPSFEQLSLFITHLQ